VFTAFDALTLGADAVRVHDQLPFHLPVVLDRPGELSRGAGGAMAAHRQASPLSNLFRYWLKIFAVAFAMASFQASSMSYQFGTNWSAFSDKAGGVIGPLMAYVKCLPRSSWRPVSSA